MKKVTQILCYYNEEKYIELAVKSLLNQTYENLEIILVNDASTDHSREIVANIHDDRIILIDEETNHGLPWCRNRGLDIATGDYIGFFDADDISDKFRIEKLVSYLEKHSEIAVVSGACDYIDEKGNIVYTKRNNLAYDSLNIQACFLFSNPIMGPCAIFRKEFMDKYEIRNDVNLFLIEDYHFWLQFIDCGGKFANIEDVLFYYREHLSQTKKIVAGDRDEYSQKVLKALTYGWELRGFRLTKQEIEWIYVYLFDNNLILKREQIQNLLALYKKIKYQAQELKLDDTELICKIYKKKMWNNLPIKNVSRTMKHFLKNLNSF